MHARYQGFEKACSDTKKVLGSTRGVVNHTDYVIGGEGGQRNKTIKKRQHVEATKDVSRNVLEPHKSLK